MSGNPYSKPNSWTGAAPGDAPSTLDNGDWAGPAEPNTVVPRNNDPVPQTGAIGPTLPTTQGAPASDRAPITGELGDVLATWAGPGLGVAPQGTWYGAGRLTGASADSGVLQLVQAMATYSADNRGFNSTPVGPAPSGPELNSALAANWH